MSHILIVEDNPEMAAVAEHILLTNGHSVTTATNTQEALDALVDGEEPVDLLLLDLNLAGERGETLVKRAELLYLPQPPIVITSAEPRTDCAYALLELGASACLIKPYSMDELLDAVKVALEDREPKFV